MWTNIRRGVVMLLGTFMAVGIGMMAGLLLAFTLIRLLWGRAG